MRFLPTNHFLITLAAHFRLTLQPEAELKAHTTTEAEVLSKILNQMAAINAPAPPVANEEKKNAETVQKKADEDKRKAEKAIKES